MVCFSGDVGASTVTWYYDGTNYQSFTRVQYALNSGNVNASIWVLHNCNAASGSSYVAINNGNVSAKGATVYELTNIGAPLECPDMTDTGGSSYLQPTQRLGNRCLLDPCTVTNLHVHLYRNPGSNPTGTIYARLRKQSDDSLIGEFGSISASSLNDGSTTQVDFNTSSVTNTTRQEVYFSIEYPSGTSSQITVLKNGDSNLFLLESAYYSSAWHDASSPGSQFTIVAVGSQIVVRTDSYGSATGLSGTNPSATCNTLTRHFTKYVYVAVAGAEGPYPDDSAPTWTNDGTHISGNEQRNGTTGSGASSNSTANSAAELVDSSSDQTGACSLATARDWAAVIACFPQTPLTASGSKPAYTKGIVYNERSSKSAYMNGTGNSPLVARMIFRVPSQSGTPWTGNQPAYLKGKTTGSSSKPAFMVGLSIYNISPDSDVTSTGKWRTQADGSTNLFESINELPNYIDTDFIKYLGSTDGQYIEFTLSNPIGTVNTSEAVVLFFRARDASGANAQLTVQLRQGSSTVIASTDVTLGVAISTYTLTLSPAEKSSITDWNDLRVRIIAKDVP